MIFQNLQSLITFAKRATPSSYRRFIPVARDRVRCPICRHVFHSKNFTTCPNCQHAERMNKPCL